jgi:hypothetical protein
MNCFGCNVSMAGIMEKVFKAYNQGLRKPVVFRIAGYHRDEA